MAAAPSRLEAGPRRLVVLAAAVLVAVALVVVLVNACGGGSDDAPAPDRAARVLPAATLVAVDLSTDRGRAAVGRATRLLGRFPSYGPLRTRLLRRLAGRAGVSYDRDIDPWLGNEAALGLLDSATGTAGSLLALAVEDQGKAEAFLRKTAGAPADAPYRGVRIETYGAAAAAFVDGFLVLGTGPDVKSAIDAAASRPKSLAADPAYRSAVGGLPADRVATVYASASGVRRLLAPQGGLLGLAGALVDRPGLQSAGVAFVPQDGGAEITARSVVNAALAGGRTASNFTPTLASQVPADALLFADATGIDRTATRLLGLATAGGLPGGTITSLLARVSQQLGLVGSARVAATLLPIARGEVAVWLTPTEPATTLTLLAKVPDEAATRQALRELQAPLAKLLVPRGQSAAQAAFRPLTVAGVRASALQLGPGVRIVYAVFDSQLVVSTSPQGIRAVKGRSDSLADTEAFRGATAGLPSKVTALGFLDFTRLLQLGEQTGLRDNQRYLAIREDLRKVRAVGVATQAGANVSTAEFHVQIP